MNAPNGTLAAIDRAIARNRERGAAKGSPSDVDLRNVRDVVAELYEALDGMLAIHDSVTMGLEQELRDKWIPKARAALAKAEQP